MSETMRRQNEPSEDLGPAPDDSYRENAYDNAHEQGESNSNDELSEKIGEELVELEYHLNPDNRTKIIGDSDWEGPSPTRAMQLHRLQREYEDAEPIRREEASKAAEEEELIQKLEREDAIETARDEIEAYIQQSIDHAASYTPQRKMGEYKDNLRNLARSSTDSEVWADRKTRMINRELFELVQKLETLGCNPSDIIPESSTPEEDVLTEPAEVEKTPEELRDEIEAYIQQSIDHAASYIPQRKMGEYKDNLRNLARSSTNSEVWANRKTRMINRELFELVQKLETLGYNPSDIFPESSAPEEDALTEPAEVEKTPEELRDEIDAYIQRSLAYAAGHIPRRKMEEYKDDLLNLARSSTHSEAWSNRRTRIANRELFELVQKLEQAEQQSDSAKN